MTTGCLRIVKESAFTGLNNYRTDSILSYDDEVYFGFTVDEIISILDVYNMQDRLSAVKDWYDGYLFGDRGVYNPWSAFDLLSTSNGIAKRYGFIYVDYKDDGTGSGDRYIKDSFYWYKKVIESNGAYLFEEE